MRLQSGRTTIVAWTVAITAVAGASIICFDAQPSAQGPSANAGSQPDDPPSWDRFAADVSIRQVHVGADGTWLRTPPPNLSLRIERALKHSDWTTALTLRDIERPLVQSGAGSRQLDNPFLIVRMEYDDDGAEPRFYNGRGERVRGPDHTDRRLLDVRVTPPSHALDWDGLANRLPKGPPSKTRPDWIDQVVARPEKRGKRQEDLEKRLGKPHGRKAGLDQYVAVDGDITYEVLVHPDSAVPVEMNATRGGELVARSTFGYEAHPAGVLVRRALHAEHALIDVKGARALTDIDVTNVTLFERGGR